MQSCIFCEIVAQRLPSHTVWEDTSYLAFLSIFPNTEGVTVVIPKEHYPSYAFDLSDEVLSGLMVATKKVAKLLDQKLEDVGRTGMVFEGFGIDHVHAKLFPLHGTADMSEWKPIESKLETYFTKYPGYISSHDAKRASDDDLDILAQQLRD
jgi:diadenosine tetraphosphate (Ap4A) HIT family hydrolase